MLLPDCKHPGLHADRPEISPVLPLGQKGDLPEIHLFVKGHLPRVDIQDCEPSFHIGERDLNDPVEPSRPKECPVKDIDPVGRPDDLDISPPLESVHPCQELHQGPLHLAIAGCGSLGPRCTDSINLIDEDDGGGLLLCKFEQFADETGAFSDIFLNKLGSDHPQEVSVGLVRHCLRKQGLPGPGRPVEEHPLGRIDPDPVKELRPLEREFHGFLYLHDLPIEPADVRIALIRGFDDLHPVDRRIVALGEDVDHRE